MLTSHSSSDVGWRSLPVVLTAILLTMAGFVFHQVLANRQKSYELTRLKSETLVLLKVFEEAAHADSLEKFSISAQRLGEAIKAFSQTTYPRVQDKKRKVDAAYKDGMTAIVEATACWAQYENPDVDLPPFLVQSLRDCSLGL